MLYYRNGKTRVDGEVSNGSQESFGLTATVAFTFAPQWGLQLRYGQSVAQNEFGLEGKVCQVKLATFI